MEVPEKDLYLMGQIDKIYTKYPFYGVPRITWQLRENGDIINHKKVARLMSVMGIQAIFPKKNLSIPNKNHEIYPYLLKGIEASYPNHIWGVDITFIKIKNDWLYLFAVIDWYSRYVLSWSLSNNLETGFCCEALTNALKIGIPEIHNSDQGSQLTAKEYLNILKSQKEVRISMDGKGRAFDNIFTERLWRSVKYEEVYLKDYQNYFEAKHQLSNYFKFYNQERPHQSLQNKTPLMVYKTERR
ncbi:MAG: Integrase catalytic subunit [Candidatus Woesebacteria bacterium GW2011_GWA1_33_30]|uniref:Integrase catalytic subunit n=1 Tax=Candidatus Woesebacteria bacterium GW2011_GWA2_33_28 TaxID=1618561 RepID=A0A0G0CU40_9BACT|nr:MAG: Integrase catalytic subunit [Candidatus Woesebacteria bacterium GW2011_GWA2_33_28]KKP47787.1 MAG: Integrase catalytic subunit [Candidatus Woesebacteria bacterium GW2011_GWA1_33_30]KKP49232.1 MAG: Integrase catalytic subunit [Microgenomates group bacterium GW2011_GWC1_33_32]